VEISQENWSRLLEANVKSKFPGRINERIQMAQTTTLDKDLKKIARLEKATAVTGRQSMKIGIGVLFLLLVLAYLLLETGAVEGGVFVIAAGVIGGYMALNIGANDVANNVGPAVGSQAITMVGALIIAAVFEASGAILAGGDVVSTIKKGIIDTQSMPDSQTFIWAMLAALMAAAVWLNLATFVGAPVSTTHSIVGGVLGAGVAAASWTGVNWVTVGAIAASWVISPLMGAIIAAAFLAVIKFLIVFQEDKVAASQRWVPVLVAIMAGAFSIYLVMKGLKHIWRPDFTVTAIIGAAAFVLAYALVKRWVDRAAVNLQNTRKAVSELFTVPLICSAAMLSFAHGANDVANAVGPLAAVVSAVSTGGVEAKVEVPIWVMLVGATGISIGLMLFGPKLVRLVGEKITKLDRMRAFTVALSASITVIIASALGLPVSSTHIAVGAVFGVGFFREYLVNRRKRALVRATPAATPSVSEQSAARVDDPSTGPPTISAKKIAKKMRKARKRKLVRRRHLVTIVAAWLITVPVSALFAAIFFFTLRGMLLP
jgi:PiT family inorganic phosphate transporter